ncbi:helix-turn-helix domain-containing protein [Promicromonospora iranensis]|uniref:Excisionase family DNA binding protein n=1 Tax=Promicromonospora iranensis TaxID=1105144 RepID=A0ABU2CWG9_9MICO|nr:helix-turn-helix domain-containing protein [Promicromonospora iranensis]MDR7385676.1 excisionase family DNA binding protein [Promicromonospora iranensis]
MVTRTSIPPDLIPADEAAKDLRVNVKTLRRWINEGRVPGYRLGTRDLRVNLAEVRAALLRPVGDGAA